MDVTRLSLEELSLWYALGLIDVYDFIEWCEANGYDPIELNDDLYWFDEDDIRDYLVE